MRRLPSPSMIVAVSALVIAVSGTAIAAGTLVSGDKLIKPRSLSGNRLRDHTITGRQLKLSRLGKVPSAVNADHASAADSATNAVNAQNAARATNANNAMHAGNANTLGGLGPGAFEPSSHFTRSGLVKAAVGQTIALAGFGPFTLSLKCNDKGGGNVQAEIDASSTEANSDGYGVQMTVPGQAYDVVDTGISSATPAENDDNAANFFSPSGQTYVADLTVGQNYLGSACYANALVSSS